MPRNFSYIIAGKLAGCARPGDYGAPRSDLSGLARQGVGAVVSLTEEPLDAAALDDAGFRRLHLPIPDFCPPTQGQIRDFVRFVDLCLEEGKAVAVHCGAGMGRTGTMLACYLVANGFAPDAAIRKVRRERPGSIETPEQEDSIREYAKNRRGSTGPH